MLVLAQILQSIEIWIWVVASELCLSKKFSVLNRMVFCGGIDRALSLQEAFCFESIGWYSVVESGAKLGTVEKGQLPPPRLL